MSSGEIEVYITNTGKKYHKRSCRYLRSSSNCVQLKYAIKLFDPCSVCNPPTSNSYSYLNDRTRTNSLLDESSDSILFNYSSSSVNPTLVTGENPFIIGYRNTTLTNSQFNEVEITKKIEAKLKEVYDKKLEDQKNDYEEKFLKLQEDFKEELSQIKDELNEYKNFFLNIYKENSLKNEKIQLLEKNNEDILLKLQHDIKKKDEVISDYKEKLDDMKVKVKKMEETLEEFLENSKKVKTLEKTDSFYVSFNLPLNYPSSSTKKNFNNSCNSSDETTIFSKDFAYYDKTFLSSNSSNFEGSLNLEIEIPKMRSKAF